MWYVPTPCCLALRNALTPCRVVCHSTRSHPGGRVASVAIVPAGAGRQGACRRVLLRCDTVAFTAGWCGRHRYIAWRMRFVDELQRKGARVCCQGLRFPALGLLAKQATAP